MFKLFSTLDKAEWLLVQVLCFLLLVCPHLLKRLIFTSVLGWAVLHLVFFSIAKHFVCTNFFSTLHKAECKCCAFFTEAKTQPKTNCSKAKPIDQKRIIGIAQNIVLTQKKLVHCTMRRLSS